MIRNLRYALAFVVPGDPCEPVQGHGTVRFTLSSPHRVVLDFEQPGERLIRVLVNGAEVGVSADNDHVVVPAGATVAGENDIALEFRAGDEALNRTDDVLYSLFVPARAHSAFPCFDQPSLKARFALSLDVPAAWQALSNGRAGDVEVAAGRTRVRFVETQPLPTYLFSFVAGRLSVERATRHGREFRMFHRETDHARLARNRDAMFDLHASSLAWLEEYTGIPYPWGKFDFVMVPGFQFSGMEHPGAILYSSELLLDGSATQAQQLKRATTIAHETAHLWFGDLVTMEWFDDVWMKEVFAGFLASKIVGPSFPEINHELRFLLEHHPAAYRIDRTAGTNPIRQTLANLSEAGQLYGEIIYHKAPIVMRQLEIMLGAEAFREGVREYLRKYSFGNATWLDLVRILDTRTAHDVTAWSRVWVEERGRPEFTTALRAQSRRVSSVTLKMSDPLRRERVWPQQTVVTLGYPGAVRHCPTTVTGRSTDVRAALGGPRPLFVLPNGTGLGYGLFTLDPVSKRHLLAHLEDVPDALTRGSAWVTLWDNLLEARVTAPAFADLVVRALPLESDEQNRQWALSCLVGAYWGHLSARDRVRRSPAFEAMLRVGINQVVTSSQKAAFFNAFCDIVSTPAGVAWLERVWRRDEEIPGLPLAEPDEIAMAFALALREVPGWRQILQMQAERTDNPARKARVAFVSPALSADPREREEAFARFRRVENRRREPWVVESLAYLNHPLREVHARRFVRPSLELLTEIQQTGDIFFPQRWIAAVLGGHRSREVAAVVLEFLGGTSDLPPRLRWTILAAADRLLRRARGRTALPG